jgi:hypothetical protein
MPILSSHICRLPSKSVKKGQKKKDSSIIVENITQKQQCETPLPRNGDFLDANHDVRQ